MQDYALGISLIWYIVLSWGNGLYEPHRADETNTAPRQIISALFAKDRIQLQKKMLLFCFSMWTIGILDAIVHGLVRFDDKPNRKVSWMSDILVYINAHSVNYRMLNGPSWEHKYIIWKMYLNSNSTKQTGKLSQQCENIDTMTQWYWHFNQNVTDTIIIYIYKCIPSSQITGERKKSGQLVNNIMHRGRWVVRKRGKQNTNETLARNT